MDKKERVVLHLAPGTSELLIALSGGKRKRGDYISVLVADMAAGKYLTIEECNARTQSALQRMLNSRSIQWD